MAWEENPRICLHMQLIAILSRTGVYMKNVEPVCRSFHAIKAFALPCLSETSNAESPTPMYIIQPFTL